MCRTVGQARLRVAETKPRSPTSRSRMSFIERFLNDEKHLDAYDRTFTGVGQIGLWTKADVCTHCDELQATVDRLPGGFANG